MSKNHKKMGKNLNYVENLLILTSAFTGCVRFLVFTSLVGFLFGIISSAIGLKIWVITSGIKNCI